MELEGASWFCTWVHRTHRPPKRGFFESWNDGSGEEKPGVAGFQTSNQGG